MALISAIAKEAHSLATDMGDRRNFDAQVNPHNSLPFGAVRLCHAQGDIRYPLAALFLDPEYPGFPFQGNIRARNTNLLCFPLKIHRKDQHSSLHAPVLLVPLTDGLFQDRQAVQLKRAFEHRLGISQGLIFDGAGEDGSEILRADFCRQQISIEGRSKDVDRADVFLAVSHEQVGLFRSWIQADLSCGFAQI